MRGSDFVQGAMFSYVDLEDRIPASHPLRKLKIAVDAILVSMSAEFDRRYSRMGRPSIPPERLLRALLLQVLYSIRSERQLMEQLDYNLLFRWFVGLGVDGDSAGGGGNAEADFKGEKRSNMTHASKTDPDARLYKKAKYLSWSQAQSSWRGNTSLAGTYNCSAYSTSSGTFPSNMSLPNTASGKTGTASITCGASGQWYVSSGTCDGANVPVQTPIIFTPTTIPTACTTTAAANYVFNAFTSLLKRPPDQVGYNYWCGEYNTYGGAKVTSNIMASSEYVTVQMTGHIDATRESAMCGTAAGYAWDGTIPTNCKGRP